jgi:hypothetical protein
MKNRSKSPEGLSGFEHSLLFMAVRYALGRTSIACASLPDEIIRNWGDRLIDSQKRMMFRDIIEYLSLEKRHHVDEEMWQKFASWLDETNRYMVEAEHEGKKETSECFLFSERYYPIKGMTWSIVPEFIRSVEKVPYVGRRWSEDVFYLVSDRRDRVMKKLPWLFDGQDDSGI